MRDLPNLDFMRSLAVCLVVLSHLLLYTRYGENTFWFIGMLGVFLFFTHTTLVLMWSLQRDDNPARFYIRRIFRIYPLWIVVLLVTMALEIPISPFFAPNFRYLHIGIREFVENLTLTFNIGGAPIGARLIGASWSLPVEVEMYVVLPFLFFFMKSYRRLWPLLLLDLLAIQASRATEPTICSTIFFCTPLFLPGAMAYVVFQKVKPVFKSYLFIFWLVGLTGICNYYASRSHNTFRPGWLYALIVGLTIPFFQQMRWAPFCRMTHIIAKYSYGIYLTHMPAIAVGFYYLRYHSLPIRLLGFFVTLSAASVILYHVVEKPLITVGTWLTGYIGRAPKAMTAEQTLELEPAP